MNDVLSRPALAFVERLHRELNPARERLLASRDERRGERPQFVSAPEDFTVAKAPADLEDRRVEITGPVDRKMMINALNSGARVFMADFEDANSPTWDNVRDGQRNVHYAVMRTIELDTDEQSYLLNDEIATLVIRPRGWHLVEKHATADLIKGQTDEGDLGVSYEHADRILYHLIRGEEPPQQAFTKEEVEIVRKRLDSTHWKRRLPTVAVVSQTAIGEFYLRPVDY